MRGLGRRWAVRILAWAMRHTRAPLRPAFDRAYRHRDQEWRDQVWKDAWKRCVNPHSRQGIER